MTEDDTENLKRLADYLAAFGMEWEHSVRAAQAEIVRLKAEHQETVNLVAWLDPSRTRTAWFRQMTQGVSTPEDAS